MTDQQDTLFVHFLGAVTAGLALWWVESRLTPGYFSLSRLIDPSAVSSLAAKMPQNEDDFILAAWDFVGREIQYQGYGSIITFVGDRVQCQRCVLSREVLRRGRGNCVAAATLLTSLLRNRLPPSRVYMAVGDFSWNGASGGHAWVQVKRGNGLWYLLEATSPVPRDPWKLVELTAQYTVQALVNDRDLVCESDKICKIAVKPHRGKTCCAPVDRCAMGYYS